MFDFVKRNKWTARIILTIMVIPFLFFGVDWLTSAGGKDVAEVNGDAISAQEYSVTLNNQRELARRQGIQNAYNTPEQRAILLYQMINNRLLLQQAQNAQFYMAKAEDLQKIIGSIPDFQENGVFSIEKYREWLRAQQISASMFDQQLRTARFQQPVLQPIQEAELAMKTSTARYLQLMSQTREIRMASLTIADYLEKVQVSDAQVEAYYKEHQAEYMMPETVSLEYILLSRDQVLKTIKVTPEEVEEEYKRNASRYSTPEKRQVAHILFDFDQGKSKAEVKKQAEEVLKEVRAKPAEFAAAAKKYSQDPGSASAGGELGEMAPDMFVKPFEEAVFAAKESGIIDHPVETEYGYHLIKVTIEPAHTRPLAEVKAQVEADLRQVRGNELFAQKAELMKNKVFEIPESFSETAQELGIPVSHADYLSRAQVAQLAKGDQHFADEVFAPQSLSDKLNTEAIDINNGNALISARVVDHKPAQLRPLAEVSEKINELLKKKAALELVVKDGEKMLAELKEGKTVSRLKFGEPVSVSRMANRPEVPQSVVQALFRAPGDKLPSYFGDAVNGDRYTVFQLDKIKAGAPLAEADLNEAGQEMSSIKANELLQAYIQQLRQDAKIKMHPERLEELL